MTIQINIDRAEYDSLIEQQKLDGEKIAQLEAAQAGRAILAAALMTYGKHERLCSLGITSKKCNCGFDAALSTDDHAAAGLLRALLAEHEAYKQHFNEGALRNCDCKLCTAHRAVEAAREGMSREDA